MGTPTIISNHLGGVIPQTYSLKQNYPNPFNPITTIDYDLPKTSNVILKIYNTLGQEVVTLVDRKQTPGEKSVVWDGLNNIGKQVSSGIYIYRLEVGDPSASSPKRQAGQRFVKSRKMVLMK